MPQSITYRVGLRMALFCVIFGTNCSSNTSQSSATQRSIGLANFTDGVEASLVYGAFRNVTSEPIVARAANPEISLTVRSGPLPERERAFAVENISPQAVLKISDVITLNSENEDGCPFGKSTLLSCEPARAAIGQTCDEISECPDGTQCKLGICEATEAFVDCTLPAFSHDRNNPTTLLFTYDVLPCRSLRFTIEENIKNDTVRVAIVGSIENKETFSALSDLVSQQNLDFFVFLGNMTSDFSPEGLDELSKILNALPIPAVVVAGDNEAVIDSGSPFLRRFGPHEHVFAHKKVKFFTFYSATGSLGEVGIQRIDNLFAQARRGADDVPFIVFTHTPPLDIDPTRDAGFRNPIEGARVHAILNRYNVNMLFAGNSSEGRQEKLGDLEVVLTGTAERNSSSTRNIVILDADQEGNLSYERVSF